MIKEKLGDHLDGWIHTAVPFLFQRPVNPNLLTVLGAIVSVGAAACFATGWLVVGGFVTLAGGFFDLVDGVVARHHGTSTRFGSFLDSTLDRLVDMALLLGLSLHFAQVGHRGGVLLAGATLVAVVLVSYSKACGERVVGPITVGILERGERVALIAVGAIFGLVIPALWVVAIGSTITVGQRFAYVHHEMTRMDAAERAGLGERAR